MTTGNVPSWSRQFLLGCTGYYLICGISALFFPASWFWAGGIESQAPEQGALLLAAISAPMFALMVAAWLASSSPERSSALLTVLVVANAVDCLVNVHAGIVNRLPLLNGLAFAAVALFWCVGAGIILRHSHQSKISG